MTKQTRSKISTQQFTEIRDIIDNIVVFTGSRACLVIEVASINFSLLSRDEQDARVSAYASFLNSLASQIQIIAVNKRVDISAYIDLLNSQISTLVNPKVKAYMQGYRQFVEQLVKQNTVLDKRFYIVIHYSYLEGGAAKTVSSEIPHNSGKDIFVTNADSMLHTKAEGIRGQLDRINLQTRILKKQELIELFAHLYGHELTTKNPESK